MALKPVMIGERIKRREDPRLIRGMATYTDDVKLHGMLHAAFVRSDHAAGRIVSIDASEARKLPGVVAVFTFDDLRSFAGIVPQYSWQCLGEMDILAPMNSKVAAYPYAKDHNFGPYGLSYADDRWELRHAVKIRMKPKNADHPYHHKDIYIDKQTYNALYSFAYDQKEELWKIIWHNHRWSEDKTIKKANEEDWYPGWEGIPKPMDLRVVSDTIVNVQTGTGNRIEFWDNHGTPFTNKEGEIAVGKREVALHI